MGRMALSAGASWAVVQPSVVLEPSAPKKVRLSWRAVAVVAAAVLVLGATFVLQGDSDEAALTVRSRSVDPPPTETTATTLPASSTTTSFEPSVTTSTRRPVTPMTGPQRTTTTTRHMSPTTTVPSSTTTVVTTGCPGVSKPNAVDTDGTGNGWMVGESLTGKTAAAASFDGGQTWTGGCLPAEITVHSRLVDVASFGHSHVWAVGTAADGPLVLYSNDAGRTWKRGAVPNVGRLQAVSFVDADHGWAVGLGWELDITGDHIGPGVIVATADGGRTWRPQPVPEGTVPLSGVAFADQNRGWATGQNIRDAQCRSVFLATTDGGLTWVPRPVGSGPGCDLVDVAVVDDRRIVAVGWGRFDPPLASASVAAISDDGGVTWQVTEIPNMILSKVAVHGQQLVAVGQATDSPSYGGGLYRSNDRGLTWVKGDRFGPGSLNGAVLFGEGHGWAVSSQDACLFVTHDRGESWRDHALGPWSCPS